MRFISKLLLISILAITVSCSKKEKEIDRGKLDNLPSWVLSPGNSQGISAVGIASPSSGGLNFQIPRAELDAKAGIAAIIQSDISRVTKNSLRSAKLNDNDDIEEFFAQATKEVIKDLPLSGVKRTNIFQAEDGNLYVEMTLTKEDYTEFLENSKRNISARAEQSNIARQNIDKVQEASKEIFEELEKERDR